MVAMVPQGIEKYALKVIPAWLERSDAASVRAYLAFGCRRILLGCVVVGVPVALWAWHDADLTYATRVAVVISCVSLPAGALVHLGMEALTAMGRPLAAATIFRVAVPALVLLLIASVLAFSRMVTGPFAIAAWGVAWCIALGLMAWQVRIAMPPGHTAALPARMAEAEWIVQARPFWIYRIWPAVLAQAGVVALDQLQPSASEVGAFAAALATASIAQILATATNRVYASRLSVLLANHDRVGVAALRHARLRWLVVPLALYLLVVLVFAGDILAFFRPEFVQDGVVPLRLLAVCIALTTLLSVEPTYFKHQGRSRTLLAHVAAAMLVQFVLLLVTVPRFGATGAAIAYGAAAAMLYAGLAWRAHRDLGRAKRLS